MFELFFLMEGGRDGRTEPLLEDNGREYPHPESMDDKKRQNVSEFTPPLYNHP